jgi:tetratricopeptide (TPR) repeat protein
LAHYGFIEVPTEKLTKAQIHDVAVKQIQGKASRFLITAITVVLVALIFACLAAFAVAKAYRTYAVESRLREIESAGAELRGQLYRITSRSGTLLGGVKVASQWGDAVANDHPDIRQLTDVLRGLIADFEQDFGGLALSPSQDFMMRLAKATQLSATGDCEEALQLLPDDEISIEIDRAEDTISRVTQALTARGYIFRQLRKWQQALECYQRIRALRPNRPSDLLPIADCQSHLGSKADALLTLGAAIRALDQAGLPSVTARDAAAIYINRGVLLHELADEEGALRDYDAAIKIMKERSRTESALSDDMLDFALYNHAMILLGLNRRDEGLKELGDAIAGLRDCAKREGRRDVRSCLAAALNSRAIVQFNQSTSEAVVADLDEAVAILDQLVQVENHSASLPLLGGFLANRARFREDHRDVAGALADYEKSATTFNELVDRRGQGEFSEDLANVLNALAWTYACARDPQYRNGEKAVQYAIRARELSRGADVIVLDTLAAAYAESGRFDLAVKWQRAAIAMTDSLAKAEFEERLKQYQEGKPFRVP